jgi:tRNA pseudouridine38-40 synthase
MRIKFIIEYDGTNLNGWHGDATNEDSVFLKDLLEQAIFLLIQQKTDFVCGGRTDAGVHAYNQTCHCDININKFNEKKFTQGLNFFLPNFVRIKKAEEVNENFHARFSAKERYYKYFINNSNSKSCLFPHAYHVFNQLDIQKMQEAAKFLEGSHDISSFCPKNYSGRRIRNLNSISLQKKTNYIIINFKAKAFAHHQVRNTVGCLIKIGLNKMSLDRFYYIFKNHIQEGFNMAPAQGLILWNIKY